MSLRIGEKVIIVPHPHASSEHSQSRRGVVMDFKWNLVLVKFENGEIDWVDSKMVKTYG